MKTRELTALVLLIVLILPPGMATAQSLVHQGNSYIYNGGPSYAVCVDNAIAGHTYIQLITVVNSNNTVSTVVDGAGNTWTKAATCINSGTNSRDFEIWYTINAAVENIGENCVNGASSEKRLKSTITLGASGYSDSLFSEWSGVTSFDKISTCLTGTSTTPATNAITPTGNGELLIGGDGASGVYGTPSGYTALNQASFAWGSGAYLVQSTAGSSSQSWAAGSSIGWAGLLAAFCPPGGCGSGSHAELILGN